MFVKSLRGERKGTNNETDAQLLGLNGSLDMKKQEVKSQT